MTAVVKSVSISPRENEFLKKNDYSASKLLQFSIMKLMESEGRTLREQPTDESQERDSNNV